MASAFERQATVTYQQMDDGAADGQNEDNNPEHLAALRFFRSIASRCSRASS